METCKLVGGLLDKPAECTPFPKFSGAGIPGIEGKLRRNQDCVDARGGNLRWHFLPIKNITPEHCTMPVEENNDDAGAGNIEFFRNVEEYPRFAISLVLPEYASRS